MKKTLFTALGIASLLLANAQQKLREVKSTERVVAFPGAEGFGKWTTGGRNGTVQVVTTLNDDGPGSLRQALEAKGPRIVVFALSGTIHLQSPLEIKANTTLAGQSAPGGGICLADQPVKLVGDNIILRYLRIRMGDRYQNRGMVHGSGHDDALSGSRRKNIIIDHCSMSWSTDEVFSVYAGDSTTLQWNLIAEPLNYSYHFEKGDTDFERHGFGGIWGGRHLSAHHNLFAHCANRTPRFDGIRNSPEENVDFRNNVIYNWGGNNIYAGEGGNYMLVNNYYKWGPNTSEKVKFQVVNPFDKAPSIPFGKFFLSGNYVDGAPGVTADNWKGVRTEKAVAHETLKMRQPFATEALPTETAQKAYENVLRCTGAMLPLRDTLDQRIITEVHNRSGRIIDVQGGYPHGTPYAETVNAWPALEGGKAPLDSDGDGMPDAWEQRNGLDPKDAGDAVRNTLEAGYNNIEVYLNSLVKGQGKQMAKK